MARSSRATTQGKAGKSDARADAPATPQTPQEAPAAPQAAPAGPAYSRVYDIRADALLMPGGAGEWKGRVTEAELIAAGANIAWLTKIGVIADAGLVAA